MRLERVMDVIKLLCALCWIIFVLADIVGLMTNPENYVRAYRIVESNPIWYQTSTIRFLIKLIIEGALVLTYMILLLMKRKQWRLYLKWHIRFIEVIVLISIGHHLSTWINTGFDH